MQREMAPTQTSRHFNQHVYLQLEKGLDLSKGLLYLTLLIVVLTYLQAEFFEHANQLREEMTDQFVASLDKREQSAMRALEAKSVQLRLMEKEKASTAEIKNVQEQIIAMRGKLKELRAQVRAGVQEAVEVVTAQHLESLKAQHREDIKVIQKVVASSANANQAVADQMKQSMVEMGTVFVGEMAQQRQFFTEVLGNVVGAYQGVIEQNQFFIANQYCQSVHRNIPFYLFYAYFLIAY